MNSVGAYEAKTHLPQLLDRVARGERITITKHGVPVAILSPVGKLTSEDRKRAIEHLIAFRQGKQLLGLSIREMIDEGRS
ncbi:MAG TPA: type II toxin-antitoxin system prevent-host-death family antitoxin [Armatimonadota bacterium]|jgi:prevent-host-death family protein